MASYGGNRDDGAMMAFQHAWQHSMSHEHGTAQIHIDNLVDVFDSFLEKWFELPDTGVVD